MSGSYKFHGSSKLMLEHSLDVNLDLWRLNKIFSQLKFQIPFKKVERVEKKLTNGHIWPQISCQHHQKTTPERGSEKMVRLGIFVWDRLKHQPDIYDNLILLIYRKIFRCLHFIFRSELFYQISAWLGYRFQIYVVFRKFVFSVFPPFLSSSIPNRTLITQNIKLR